MVQNPNQRLQNTEQGQVDLLINPAIIAGQIAVAETASLVAGSPIKLSDVVGAVPQFLLATADDDAIFGYIVRNIKDSTFVALEFCEVAFSGSVMYMTAGAAIARGAKVESDVSLVKVITQSANPVVGIALDKAAADGDLIRVLITAPGSEAAGSFTTLAASGAVTFGSTLTVTGVSTFNGPVVKDVNDYSAGAGALPITKPVIALTTGGAEALTLADGVEGQELKIVMVSDGGIGTVTPANFGSGTTIAFDGTDSANLIFLGTSWWTVGTPTATVA